MKNLPFSHSLNKAVPLYQTKQTLPSQTTSLLPIMKKPKTAPKRHKRNQSLETSTSIQNVELQVANDIQKLYQNIHDLKETNEQITHQNEALQREIKMMKSKLDEKSFKFEMNSQPKYQNKYNMLKNQFKQLEQQLQSLTQSNEKEKDNALILSQMLQYFKQLRRIEEIQNKSQVSIQDKIWLYQQNLDFFTIKNIELGNLLKNKLKEIDYQKQSELTQNLQQQQQEHERVSQEIANIKSQVKAIQQQRKQSRLDHEQKMSKLNQTISQNNQIHQSTVQVHISITQQSQINQSTIQELQTFFKLIKRITPDQELLNNFVNMFQVWKNTESSVDRAENIKSEIIQLIKQAQNLWNQQTVSVEAPIVKPETPREVTQKTLTSVQSEQMQIEYVKMDPVKKIDIQDSCIAFRSQLMNSNISSEQFLDSIRNVSYNNTINIQQLLAVLNSYNFKISQEKLLLIARYAIEDNTQDYVNYNILQNEELNIVLCSIKAKIGNYNLLNITERQKILNILKIIFQQHGKSIIGFLRQNKEKSKEFQHLSNMEELLNGLKSMDISISSEEIQCIVNQIYQIGEIHNLFDYSKLIKHISEQ